MIRLFIFFFFFLYSLCEMTKYRKIVSMKLKTEKYERLYNKPVVYVKFVLIILVLILVIINRFTSDGKLEGSSGLYGFLYILLFFLIFTALSFRDFIRVKNGHNEKILENSGLTEEERVEYE